MEDPVGHQARKKASFAFWERPKKDSGGGGGAKLLESKPTHHTTSAVAHPTATALSSSIQHASPTPHGGGNNFVGVQRLIQQYSARETVPNSIKPTPPLISNSVGIDVELKQRELQMEQDSQDADDLPRSSEATERPISISTIQSNDTIKPEHPNSDESKPSTIPTTLPTAAVDHGTTSSDTLSESASSSPLISDKPVDGSADVASSVRTEPSHLDDGSSSDPKTETQHSPHLSKSQSQQSLSPSFDDHAVQLDPPLNSGDTASPLEGAGQSQLDHSRDDWSDSETCTRDPSRARRQRRLLKEQLKRRSKRRSVSSQVIHANDGALPSQDLPHSDDQHDNFHSDVDFIDRDSSFTPESSASSSRPSHRQQYASSTLASSSPDAAFPETRLNSPASGSTSDKFYDFEPPSSSSPTKVSPEQSFLPTSNQHRLPNSPVHSNLCDSQTTWHEPVAASHIPEHSPSSFSLTGQPPRHHSQSPTQMEHAASDCMVRSPSMSTSASTQTTNSPVSPCNISFAAGIATPTSPSSFILQSSPSGGLRLHRAGSLPPPRPTPNLPLPSTPTGEAAVGVTRGNKPLARPSLAGNVVVHSSITHSRLKPTDDLCSRNRSHSLGQAAVAMVQETAANPFPSYAGHNKSTISAQLPKAEPLLLQRSNSSGPTVRRGTWTGAAANDTRHSLDALAVKPEALPRCEASLPSSATIVGRPRGFTVGAVPASSGYSSYGSPSRITVPTKLRPRSLLCNEILLGLDLAQGRALSTPSSHLSALGSSSSWPTALTNLTSITATTRSFDKTTTALPPNSHHFADPSSASRKTSATTNPAAANDKSTSSNNGEGMERRPSSTNRSRSGSSASLLQQVKSQLKSHASFVIAVVGHHQAGKSTVIKKGLRQFGLSKPHVLSEKVTSHSTVCVVDQEQRTIEVLEIDASVLLNGPGKRFAWPKFFPLIDAVILCYDAAQIVSFRGMSELLENFASSNLSTVMLACKSEIHPKAVDPYYASDMASVYNVGLAECTVQSEEGKKRMRDCFSYLVKEVAKSRSGRGRKAIASTVPPHPHYHQLQRNPSSQSQSQQPCHSHDGSTGGSMPSTTDPNDTEMTEDSSLRGSISSSRARGDSTASSVATDSLVSSSGLASLDMATSRSLTDASSSQGTPPALSQVSRASSIELYNTPRKMSDATVASVFSDMPSQAGSEDDLALQESIAKAKLGLQNARSTGGYVTIDELWDKLFHAAVSGNDDRFLVMFMVFYRGFAQPIDLLRQMVARFEDLSTGERSEGVMVRFALIRLTTMLGDWVQDYPGDLSHAETYTLLTSFYTRLLQHPITTHTASQMRVAVEAVGHSPDVDALWSKSVNSDTPPSSVAAELAPLKPKPQGGNNGNGNNSTDQGLRSQSLDSESATGAESRSVGGAGSETSLLPVYEISRNGRHRSASDLTTSSTEGSTPRTLPSSLANMVPGIGNGFGTPTSGLGIPLEGQTRSQYQKSVLRNVSNSLMEIDDELIAAELTRLEWLFFTAIRPRDLLRHILVPRELRDGPVARSIAHFNYISSWVCSMILAQGKTKHRARMMEKFYNIASLLRHDNNYGSLQSVLGGLSKTSVHRLKQTRELLKGKPINKSYQSLVRLMSSERSNAAYRLALENSEGPTIPYVGVHLQDILSISDGNPSKRPNDGMIHWRKFSLMDEAVMTIVKCQQYDRTLKPIQAVERLMIEIPVLDDEQLYERSLVVEPRTATGPALTTSKIKDLKIFLQNASTS